MALSVLHFTCILFGSFQVVNGCFAVETVLLPLSHSEVRVGIVNVGLLARTVLEKAFNNVALDIHETAWALTATLIHSAVHFVFTVANASTTFKRNVQIMQPCLVRLDGILHLKTNNLIS